MCNCGRSRDGVAHMANTLSYEFNELPLVIDNGVEAGLINGCAEVLYRREGDWQIDSVCIEGWQGATQEERAAGKSPWVYVAAPDEIATLIVNRLNTDWRSRVQNAVNEELDEARAA